MSFVPKIVATIEAQPRNPVSDLLEMLKVRRPAFSKSENAWIAKWLIPLGATDDDAGNMILRVGTGSQVLWSCHTDTVHSFDGPQGIEVLNGIVSLKANSKSNCLGADCTTGVWLMREMILAGVPGLYVFHASEEVGGVGSRHIATKTPELLADIKYAIAFDRMDHDEVITHQAGGMCASKAFAVSLAALLPGNYRPSADGVFTDTAYYTDLIPECTNISVGYKGQHTRRETQDLRHAVKLRDALVVFDETKLVEARTAGQDDWESQGYSQYLAYANDPVYVPDRTCRTLQEFVKLFPDETADFLEQMGVDLSDLYSGAPWLN